jgi:5-methylthioribose kinase
MHVPSQAEPWLIDLADQAGLERYLIACGLLSPNDLPIEVARAGAGNMNLALRITTAGGRSLVLKQGRPWVEKYPQIAAPFERTLVEAAFYAAVQSEPAVAARMPAVLQVDRQRHVLVLEDVGSEGDFTPIYGGEPMPAPALAALLDWLRDLARVALPAAARTTLVNRAMRALNHEHMFRVPLDAANGLDQDGITPGLGAAARELTGDPVYGAAVAALGARYLADGATLVHGDYFPGSWLKDAGGIRIIDPEFCFPGDPEFDCGVLAAHLALAQCGAAHLEMVAAAADARHLDLTLVAGFAGVEIMRRLIGVAQVPVTGGIETKRALLRLSRRLVVEPQRGLV